MSDARYRLTRHVAAPPDAVRAALDKARRGAGPIPRPRGIHGVRGKVRGDRFALWPDHNREGVDTELAGMIVPAEDGGSEVRASVLDSPREVGISLGMIGIGVVLGVTIGGVGWMLAGLGAVGGIASGLRRATSPIKHDEAAYLLAWLNAVLDGVPTARPHPSPDGLQPGRGPEHRI